MHGRNLHYLHCKVKTAENNPTHIVKKSKLQNAATYLIAQTYCLTIQKANLTTSVNNHRKLKPIENENHSLIRIQRQ